MCSDAYSSSSRTSKNMTLESLKEHVYAALKANVTPVEMKEAIYQCTPYIGVGKVKEALDAVHDVFVENQIELPLENQSTVEEETRFQAGFDVQSEAFGRKNIPFRLKIELTHPDLFLLYKSWIHFIRLPCLSI